jgi:hypothetical protein
MRTRSIGKVMAAVAIAMVITGAAASHAADWRGATDASGLTWARIRIDNQSAQASNWSISNCRTATSAGHDAAVTDASLNWNGVAAPGASTYVWVYGVLSGDVLLDNADGGASALAVAASPVDGGDGEWVVSIAADGSVTTYIEAAASYGIPSRTGTLPNEG